MGGACCIAAHVTSGGGLFTKLSGQSRINVWKNPDLLACALTGTVEDASAGLKQILTNKDSHYKRERMPALLNASDVNDPCDLDKDVATCFIKMSEVSVEALRQAFLDPESRVQLNSDPVPESHAEFRAIIWEGGFLDGTAVHFNENFNVLIGGRGTGKSTIIESLRYVLGLDPIGEDASKTHNGIVRKVLQPGTKISLLVRSYKPTERCYRIERSVPNPPIVKNKSGEVLTLAPSDVMPNVDVFGQHEISELTKSPEKLTKLLERFVDLESFHTDRKVEVKLNLEKSRRRIVSVERELKMLEDRLAMLPSLKETLNRYQEAGLEERFKEKSMLVREERLFASLEERLTQYREIGNELSQALPVDTAFVSHKALENLPNAGNSKKH